MLARIDEIGGPLSHNNYPWGWTMAGNTPFKRWKREVHEGGVADPCIVRLPRDRASSAGAVRHQFAHAIDVLPTVLELAGVEAPPTIDHVTQSHLDGVSFAYLLDDAGADAPGRHVTQHFEMFGSRAIYHDGWKAVTFHPVGPIYGDGLNPNAPFGDDVWELYHVAEDLSESRDLAAAQPERVAQLEARWWEEARRNQVLPLDNRVLWTLVHPKPDHRQPRTRYRYFQDGAAVPESVAAAVQNRSHRITVTFESPPGVTPSGVLLAVGSALGGWSLHLLDGRPVYVHNLYGKERHVLSADRVLSPGRHTVQYRFEKDAGLGGPATLWCDGDMVSEGAIPRFTIAGFNGVGVGLTCGYEWGPAVGEGYVAPFRFNGRIGRAEVEATGPVVRDPMAELEAILAEQ
jgi:arylsulfatase